MNQPIINIHIGSLVHQFEVSNHSSDGNIHLDLSQKYLEKLENQLRESLLKVLKDATTNFLTPQNEAFHLDKSQSKECHQCKIVKTDHMHFEVIVQIKNLDECQSQNSNLPTG